ncbi:hypothetical protein CSKR_105973 [Clonorchis sinensis]|uniref:Uncharacterized protein n=1 Tax=Clonorchis sinensis TaxID=79923 RepID=A0A419PZ89_CLOSI|nr:hypothetical protein CSKR_105973 [Clonorchis sinensis]
MRKVRNVTCLLSAIFRRAISSRALRNHQSILVVPLCEGLAVHLPPHFEDATKNLEVYFSAESQHFLGRRHSLPPTRRAEYARQQKLDYLDQVLQMHTTRTEIQIAIYLFALEVCLGLSTATSSARALLDLGCGSMHALAPIRSVLESNSVFSTGIDLPSSSLPGDGSNRIHCDLIKRQPPVVPREFTHPKVRVSNLTSASRLPLSRLGQPGSIPAVMLPSGDMSVSTERVLHLNDTLIGSR